MVKAIVDAVDIDPKTGTALGLYTYGTERPNVLIVSAMDGLSATCVYLSYLLMKHFESLGRVDGSVTLLPVANPLAFRLGTRVSPLDSKDLDTLFPGSEHGTVSERIAWEIWRKASQADYVIHLRTGHQSCVSHIEAMHRKYIHVRNLASQIGLPLVVQSTGQRGALTTEVAHEGIPVVTIEMRGERSQVEPQAAVQVREAILNFLRIKGILSGESLEVSNTLAGRVQHINVDTEGFFVPIVNPGEDVRRDEAIGQVQDKDPVRSPHEGTIISVSKMNYVFEGDLIARIAPPLIDQWVEKEHEEDRPKPIRRKW